MHKLSRSVLLFLFACLFTVPRTIAGQTTGTFGTCDPVIHDQLVGAEWRSPSECEVKFDSYVRNGLTAALQPVIDNLTANSWSVARHVELQSLTSIPRHTETKPFQLNEQQMHQNGEFYLEFTLDQNSPLFQQYDQTVQAVMKKLGDALKSVNAANMTAAQNALQDATKAEVEHTSIRISVSINSGSVGVSSFKGGHTVTTLPGVGFAVSAPFVQAPTGGDISATQRVTYVFLGPFTPPSSTGPSTGDEDFQVKGSLSSATARLLSVQNICIRIQTGTDLAQQIIQFIDWSALRKLMVAK
jgi:hypothetical protein